MTELKAIETRYKGYRFRSRLEARWAVFFDELKATFDYEPEGFKLPSGATYLPDFRINVWIGMLGKNWGRSKGELDVTAWDEGYEIRSSRRRVGGWLEIKPPRKLVKFDTERILEFSKSNIGSPILIGFGDPFEMNLKLILYSPETKFCMAQASIVGCKDGCLSVLATGRNCSDDQLSEAAFTFREHWLHGARKARSARFEHGESG